MAFASQVQVGSAINSMAYLMSNRTVWSGNENGHLCVWRSCLVDGGLAAEQYYCRIGKVTMYPDSWIWSFETTLELVCGHVKWKTKKGQFQSILVSSIQNMKCEGGKISIDKFVWQTNIAEAETWTSTLEVHLFGE